MVVVHVLATSHAYLRDMREPHASRPTCVICGWSMMPEDSPSAAGQPDFVCVNAECLEFGIFKSLAGRS